MRGQAFFVPFDALFGFYANFARGINFQLWIFFDKAKGGNLLLFREIVLNASMEFFD